MLRHIIEGTMRTSAMIMAILIGAYFLNFVLASIGLTGQVKRQWSPGSAGRRWRP